MWESLVQMWAWLLGGHTDLTTRDYVLAFIFSFLGASSYAVTANPTLVFPRFENGELRLGVVGTYVLGISAAIAIGHKIPVPFFVGILAPGLIPLIISRLESIATSIVSLWKKSKGG